MRAGKGVSRCLIAGAVLLGCALFAAHTDSTWVGARSDLSVNMSRPSGFYDEGFLLEMDSAGGEIRYTLDSSEPNEGSTLYTGPVPIDDASDNENVYSRITDVCLDLNEELLASEGMTPQFGYKVPGEPVDKATVVRAVCFDAMGRKGREACAVYFVGLRRKKAYQGMATVAITTNPENLFGYEKGIYVLGKTFDDGAGEVKYTKTPASYRLWPANYKNRGKQWEREAFIRFFDADGEELASGQFGIRIQGNVGRGMLPKSLNIYAREKYGTQALPGQALFGVEYPIDRLNLNSGSDGMETMLADDLVNELTEGMDFGTRAYVPCQMFLDGEYWGVYWLTPRYKADYFEGEYGIPGDNVVEINSKGVELGKEEDYALYQAMMDQIARGDMRDPAQYEKACRLIDMDSCLDYFATEIYIANIDWPGKNQALWRAREAGDQPWADGRWRWLLYDVSYSMNPANATNDYIQRAADRDGLFCSLLDNPQFESALHARLARLAEDRFHPQRVSAFIEAYQDRMGDAMENEYNRFFDGEKTRQDFVEACQEIDSFFQDRYRYIMEKYGDEKA